MASFVSAGMRRQTKIIAVLVLLALLALALFAWRERRRADDAEQRLGIDAGRVVTAVFTNARDLRVARLTGEAIARSTNDGRLFSSQQETKAPYSVSYHVDLKRVGQDDLAWDARSRTMIVRIPDVVAEAPAVDFGRAQVKQSGVWVSRRAGIELQRRGAQYLTATVQQTARSEQNMASARRAAVAAVTAYVRQPLAATGLRDVRVEVLFPWQGEPSRERWNESRPVAEVLREAH